MSGKKEFLDPKQNDLIPEESISREKEEELPYDPELTLVPGYAQEPPKAAASGVDWITDELARTKADPNSFDDGLSLKRRENGGLHVYKGDRIIRDISELEPDELRTIKKYLESSR